MQSSKDLQLIAFEALTLNLYYIMINSYQNQPVTELRFEGDANFSFLYSRCHFQ